MLINRKTYSKCKFADLLSGECFLYNDNLYIKLSNRSDELNAFNCNTNVLGGIDNSILVSRINIELTEV